MNQKKKRPAARRALSGLLALMLVVSLVQQYPVSAQESEQQITEQQGENNDSGSEQEEGVIVTGEEVKSPEGQNTDEGFENSGEEKNGQAEENSDQSGEQTSNPQTTDGPETGVEVQPGEDTQGGTVQTEDGQPEMISDDTEGKAAARISFRAVRAELEDVEVTLEINGVAEADPIQYPAGRIKDNLDSLNLSENTVFQKAVVRMPDGTESEIVRIGKYEESVYYSLGEQEDVGILLKEGASIVLICASQYEVTYNCTPENGGSYSGPTVLTNGNDLNVVINAASLYHIKEITWECEDGSNGSGTITNQDSMTLTIPAAEIKDDIRVNIIFAEDGTYRIYENEDSDNRENSGIQHGDLCLNDDAENIPDVVAGGNSTFWMYSESNTGGSDFYLTQLKVNGENVGFPEVAPDDNTNVDAVAPVTTTLSSGTKLTVKLLYVRHQIGWKGDDAVFPTNDKYRTVYEVTAENVTSDLSFEGYFKQRDDREMLMIPNEGIASVGAVQEDLEWWQPGWGTGANYVYTLQPNDGNTSYNAFYNRIGDFSHGGRLATAYNIYLYSVSPGYNPYTVDLKVYYDWIEQENVDDLFETRMGDTSRRPWVTVEELSDILFTSDNRHYDGLSESIQQAGYQYSFVLKQNESYNQKLELTAHPYLYNMVFDLNGGTYEGTGLDTAKYKINGELVTEKNENGDLLTYTLRNGGTFANMPIAEPVKEGYVFAGWKLYQGENPVSETIYSSNQQFSIDSESIQYAEGDIYSDEGHTFTFVAQWQNLAENPDMARITTNYYREDPKGDITVGDKTYTLYRTTVDSGTVGDRAVILNGNRPDGDYTVNEEISTRSIVVIDEDDPQYVPDKSNVLALYYDLASYDLTIIKDAQGDSDLTREWEIQVTLKDANGDDLEGRVTYGKTEFTDGVATVKLKDEDPVTVSGIPTGYKYSIKEINVPDDYKTVQYQINSGDLTTDAPEDVPLTADTKVKVINDRDLEPSDTGIDLGGIATVSGIGIAGIGALVFCLLYLRRRHVR